MDYAPHKNDMFRPLGKHARRLGYAVQAQELHYHIGRILPNSQKIDIHSPFIVNSDDTGILSIQVRLCHLAEGQGDQGRQPQPTRDKEHRSGVSWVRRAHLRPGYRDFCFRSTL